MTVSLSNTGLILTKTLLDYFSQLFCDGLYHHSLGFEHNLGYYAAFPILHKFTLDTLGRAFELQQAFNFAAYLELFNGTVYDYDFYRQT